MVQNSNELYSVGGIGSEGLFTRYSVKEHRDFAQWSKLTNSFLIKHPQLKLVNKFGNLNSIKLVNLIDIFYLKYVLINVLYSEKHSCTGFKSF